MMPTRKQLLAGAGVAGVGLLAFSAQPAPKPAAPPEIPIINLPAGVDVFVEKKVRPYEITGTSGAALKDAMSAQGPAEWFEHHWAYTQWAVNWQYQYDKDAATCALKLASIGARVQITQILPLWKDYATAPESLQQAWNAFDTALVAHEDQHAHIGVETAKAVLTALRALPPQHSCSEMAGIASKTAKPIVENGHRRDVALDAQTNHGMNDFPPLP